MKKQTIAKRGTVLLILLVILLAVSGCTSTPKPEEPAQSDEPVETGNLDNGSPWVDYDLTENIAQVKERPADAKDDLYLYANYDWLKKATIRPGFRSEGTFNTVSDEIRNMSMEVLKDNSLESEDAKMVQSFYNAWLDWDARNALGVEPVAKIIDRIKAVKDLDGLSALLCEKYLGVEHFAQFSSSTGINDPETYLYGIGPMGLFLSDSAEYSNRTEYGERREAAYRAAAEKMMAKFGYSKEETNKMMDSALALEGDLATSIMTSAESMAPDSIQRMNNEMSLEEAYALCKNYPLKAITEAWGYGHAERCLVTQPEFLKKLDTLYTQDRLEDMKNYMILCAALDNMSNLDRESYEIYVERNNAINGSTGMQPDEEVGFDLVRSSLTTPMDRAFLDKYDSTKIKEDITSICNEVVAYYREMLKEEDWLSAQTREKAIEKLDNLTINAVYPEKWRDYSGLSLDGLGYYDCIDAIGKFERDYNISKLNKKDDHELWSFDILETNAYYNPMENSINIIRGILGDAFYREDMSKEELYAGVGSIIGHEISHAFDTTGAQFDATGKLSNWWTEDDYKAFQARAQRLIDYYNTMTAFDSYQVQGNNIQKEAIADMAGLKCMLGLLSKQENPDYRVFFENFAKVWARINTREYEYICLMQDSHPLHYLRTNATVQQFEEFHQAFDIKEGDGMYLSPENRIPVW